MAKNENRVYVTLECTQCHKATYTTEKNKKNNNEKLELKKACNVCGHHTVFKEKK